MFRQGVQNLDDLAVLLDLNPSLSASVRHLRLTMQSKDSNAFTSGVSNTFGFRMSHVYPTVPPNSAHPVSITDANLDVLFARY